MYKGLIPFIYTKHSKDKYFGMRGWSQSSFFEKDAIQKGLSLETINGISYYKDVSPYSEIFWTPNRQFTIHAKILGYFGRRSSAGLTIQDEFLCRYFLPLQEFVDLSKDMDVEKGRFNAQFEFYKRGDAYFIKYIP